jgi:hypothetical protein
LDDHALQSSLLLFDAQLDFVDATIGEKNLVNSRHMRLQTPFVNCGREVLLALRRHVRSVRTFLQPFAVDDGDVAAARGDETCFFQRLQSNRHARTMGAEHEAEKLVRERELLAVDAVGGVEGGALQ